MAKIWGLVSLPPHGYPRRSVVQLFEQLISLPPPRVSLPHLVEGNIIPTDTSPTIRSAMGIPIASPPRVSLLNRRIDPTLTLGGRQHHPHGYPRRSKLYLVTGYHSPTLSPLSPLISPNSPNLISVD